MEQSKNRGESPTGNEDADALLRSDGNALLIAVLLDQQVRAEMAFEGPQKLKERLGHLDMKKISEMDLEALQDTFKESPAIHRFTNMMAGRVQDLARSVAEKYDGEASNLWAAAAEEDEVEARASELPGFGKSKVSTLKQALSLFGYREF